MAGCQNQSDSTNTSIPQQSPASSSSTSDISTPTPNEDVSEEEPEPVQRKDADFRNAKWGDDKETIIENENIKLVETEEGLVGEGRVNDLDTWVIYVTDNNDKLYRALYDFNKFFEMLFFIKYGNIV